MARLFGLIGNRADLAGRVLLAERDVLKVRVKEPGRIGWGIGFHQGGEVLMRKRPIDEHDEIDFGTIASDIRGDVVIGHVRQATVGALRTENTHPFRYRQWVFAQTGTIDRFDSARDRLMESVPEFLRSGIRGDTDSEIVFHIFLSFLHDEGLLNEAQVADEAAVKALRGTLALVDSIAAEIGAEPPKTNILVTGGRSLCAIHRGERMGYRAYAGKNDGESLVADDFKLKQKTPELGAIRFGLLASDFDVVLPSRWKPCPENSVLTVDGLNEPIVQSLT